MNPIPVSDIANHCANDMITLPPGLFLFLLGNVDASSFNHVVSRIRNVRAAEDHLECRVEPVKEVDPQDGNSYTLQEMQL